MPAVVDFVQQVAGQAAGGGMAVGQQSAPVAAEAGQLMVEMGIEEVAARRALQAAGGDVNDAINMVYG